MSKKRVDVSGEVRPLTDNPLATLAERAAHLPSNRQTASDTTLSPSRAERLPYHVAKTRKGGLPVFVEKRAKGKTVTVIRNVSGDAEALLRKLKKRCGAGGVVRDGDVEVQGDHRAAVEDYLRTL